MVVVVDEYVVVVVADDEGGCEMTSTSANKPVLFASEEGQQWETCGSELAVKNVAEENR